MKTWCSESFWNMLLLTLLNTLKDTICHLPFWNRRKERKQATNAYELWFSEVQLSWRDSPMFLHIIDSHSRPDDHEYQYDHQYDAALRLKDVALCRVLIQFQSFYHGLRSRCILQNGSYEYSFHQLHLPSKFYSGTEWF